LLRNKLGEGGQGSVFSGVHSISGEPTALKLFPYGVDPEYIRELKKRIDREIAALRRVDHFAIVKVFDSGELLTDDPANRGYLWVAYELIDGADLSEKLRKPRGLRQHSAINVITHLAHGLEEAHELGIVHRDIKPSNIILRDGKWDKPVLVDFGCVHVENATTLTATIGMMGTANYMAPELRRNAKAASRASDQWAFARLALEMMSVANGEAIADVMTTPVAQLLEDTEEDLPNVYECLSTALSDSPSERFESVSAFSDALFEAAIQDDLIEDRSHASKTGVQESSGQALAYRLSSIGFEVIDKRPAGCLWIVASYDSLAKIANDLSRHQISLHFAENGSKTTGGRPAWWTKASL
jgi:serine/threonine-protein kinase